MEGFSVLSPAQLGEQRAPPAWLLLSPIFHPTGGAG